MSLAAAGALVASVPAAVEGQVSPDDPRLNLVVRVEDRYVRGTVGDYCLKITRDGRIVGSGCADANVDVRRLPRIRVARGGEVELRPDAPASQVRVFAGRPPPRKDLLPVEVAVVEARQVGSMGTRWRARLPRRRFTYIRILVRYGSPQEYASFFVGIRTAGRCRAASATTRSPA
jgi:hypothetical protein